MQNAILDSLRRIWSWLNQHEVEYILIGGIAVGFYGYPRATADIDFWYNPTVENYKIVKALDELGVDTSDLKALGLIPKGHF